MGFFYHSIRFVLFLGVPVLKRLRTAFGVSLNFREALAESCLFEGREMVRPWFFFFCDGSLGALEMLGGLLFGQLGVHGVYKGKNFLVLGTLVADY